MWDGFMMLFGGLDFMKVLSLDYMRCWQPNFTS